MEETEQGDALAGDDDTSWQSNGMDETEQGEKGDTLARDDGTLRQLNGMEHTEQVEKDTSSGTTTLAEKEEADARSIYVRNLNVKDVYISYLPLAHIFDRAIEECIIMHGASIGFWRGDVKLLLEDIGVLKPSIFCAVPRVLDRIYSGGILRHMHCKTQGATLFVGSSRISHC